MKDFILHLRKYVSRGFIALIPLVLTIFVVNFLYGFLDERVSAPVSSLLGFRIPGLGLVLLVTGLYLVGLAASNLVGRAFLSVIERTTSRIPLIGRAYSVGKQLSETLTLPERSVFRRVVLVQFLSPGTWTIGFVTGTLTDNQQPGSVYYRVYVPTPPNPLSGTLLIVPESSIREPGWSVEEALRAVLSGGLIGPATIEQVRAPEPTQ